jgi:pyruvate kinase
MSKTKIVCTIGPASNSFDRLKKLIQAGMSVARLNFSHGTRSEHGEVIKNIRHIARELNKPVAILQDLAGPKIRIGQISSGTVLLEPGKTFTLTTRLVAGNENEVSVNYPDLPKEIKQGDTLLLSDGAIELKVIETSTHDIRCQVIVGGYLSSNKGINLPTRSLKIPILTEKDKEDLVFGIEQGVDYIALSFVRTAKDILDVKEFMKKQGKTIPIIAKIEKHEALNNMEEIIKTVEGIMIARGDLGVEIPIEKIPMVQKKLIKKANQAGKPVITATQMLRSMVESPKPTRAEVTDVANAIIDGTDALMLSEETAIGKYPIEAVEIVRKIADDVEPQIRPEVSTKKLTLEENQPKTLTEAVSFAACTLAEDINADAIITFTKSGTTAQMVSKYRPRSPILAVTPSEDTYRSLSLVWGVTPILCRDMENTDEMFEQSIKAALGFGLIKRGNKVVITAGIPLGITGKTNLIKAEVIE